MLLELKSCYAPSDLIFVLSLLILTLTAVGAFITLMTYLIRDSILTVMDFRKDNANK
jgi:hypothetical protein